MAKKILIVEDSKLFSGLIEKKVSADFSVDCIARKDYAAAVALLEENSEQFFLAILDLNLPGAPNGEIVTFVASKNIPIIVLTSSVNDEIRDKIISLKLIDYILKGPQALVILTNTIRRYFRNLNFHILLVDDSKFSRDLTKTLLESQYFQIVEAENGIDALEALQENKAIKLLITDYHMPEMDGFELTRQVRAKHSMEDIAIIGISARGNPLLASQFLKCGANDFLTKPYFEEELIWRVNQNVEILDFMAQRRTYQVQLEEEVTAKTAKIKESQAMVMQQEKLAAIGQLAAGVAHEINNPTGFISSNLSALKKYLNKLMKYMDSCSQGMSQEELVKLRKKLKIDFIIDDINDLMSESSEGIERIKEIVKNLKIFSRKDEMDAKEANINECLENTLKVIWNELKYKAEVVKEYGELPMLLCYPQQLNQVFMNFLVNAAHAIEEQGEIKIRTWSDGRSIMVTISDTGHGISPEHLNKLFEPFFTTKEVGKGTGLGLSIASEIIQNHKGKIHVASEVGIGTSFTVTLPLAGISSSAG